MTRSDRIVREVAAKYRIHPNDLAGDSHSPIACKARSEAAARMHEIGMSSTTIGRVLDRHYSSVLKMIQKFREPRKPELAAFDPSQPDYSGEWAI